MKKIVFLVFASFLLFGCAQNSDGGFAEKNEDSLNLFNDDPAIVAENRTAEDPLGIMQDDEEMSLEQKEFLFKKNQECLKYKEQISKKLQEKNSAFGETSLEQIFYSPKQNSCLYIEYADDGGVCYSRRMFDILDDGDSSHPIDACVLVGFMDECEELNETIREYKGL